MGSVQSTDKSDKTSKARSSPSSDKAPEQQQADSVAPGDYATPAPEPSVASPAPRSPSPAGDQYPPPEPLPQVNIEGNGRDLVLAHLCPGVYYLDGFSMAHVNMFLGPYLRLRVQFNPVGPPVDMSLLQATEEDMAEVAAATKPLLDTKGGKSLEILLSPAGKARPTLGYNVHGL